MDSALVQVLVQVGALGLLGWVLRAVLLPIVSEMKAVTHALAELTGNVRTLTLFVMRQSGALPSQLEAALTPPIPRKEV